MAKKVRGSNPHFSHLSKMYDTVWSILGDFRTLGFITQAKGKGEKFVNFEVDRVQPTTACVIKC